MSIRSWFGSVRRLLGFNSESAPESIDRVFARMLSDAVPQRIGRAEALGVPAVLRGRNLICSISTLPLEQYGPRRQVVDNPLFEQIDPDVANVVTLAQTVEDLLFEGIAWWEIIEFDNGWPSAAKHRDVGSVTLQPPANGKTPSPLPGGHDPRGAVVYVDGREVPATSMIRFDSPNPGLLKAAGRPIRRALLLDAAAAMYADEPRPMDYFTPAEDADPADDTDIQEILDAWKAARKKRSTAYVPKALKYNTVEQPNPRDLQLVELQMRATLDIANSIGLDPEDLGVSTTSRTYQNGIDRRQDRINDVLSAYMKAITDRLTMRDVTRRGQTVRFDLDDYLRADPLTRWQVYRIASEIGAIEVSEIRAEERMPALPDGRPLPPRRVPAVVGRPIPEVAAAGVGAGMQLNQEPAHTFVGLPSAEQFSVNVNARTIEGIVVPYGRVARKYHRKFRFAPGSLQFSDLGRIKMLRDHSYALSLGRAIFTEERPEGVFARFKIKRGPEGDQALVDAEDGAVDGLSIGVDFDEVVDTVPDPENDGVTLVRRADWRETSLTAIPAFDDARVSKVAASRIEGNSAMECTRCGHVHAEGVACIAPNTDPATATAPASQPTTLTATAVPTVPAGPAPAATPAPAGPTFGMADLPALLALMQQHGTVGIQPPAAPQQPAPEQRAVVNPIRNGEQTAGTLTAAADPTRLTASVTEAAPYRFDSHGNIRMGTHDFSTDLIAGVRDKDDTAARRAMEFVRVQLDATNTTDTGALNPARQRPDLYVDQREFLYPVWDAISKGALTDITPFIFPKFSAASGLVGNHTEGTEPTVGDAAWTSQTVTPSAISGKAEINREVWDQGGNPQVSNLIWRQMTRGWGEALEAAAVGLLDAASPTALGTFTTGGGTTGQTLAAELRAALAALHFVRGGFRFTDGFAQIDFYKALTGALDDAGRPLFPAVGPSNADGTVRNRYQAVDVNGLDFLPAWALAASGAVAASSYIFDREAVHGWASAPQRLEFNVQVKSVYIAIWGYRATAISDISGVREISYDPAA